MTYAGADARAVAVAGADAGAVAVAGASAGAVAVADGVRGPVGQAAPVFTHSTSVSISSGRRRPPFGIFSFSLVCRTAWISRLLSGSPGTTAGCPELPPFSAP